MSTTLAIEPEERHYSLGQVDKLQSDLRKIDLATEIVSVESPSDVELSPSGTFVTSGFRPTTWCLYQLCSIACPGIHRAAIDIATANTDAARLAAISIINQVIRLRFLANFHGKRLLFNRDRGTVDAVVGSSYRFISNVQFCDVVSAAVADVPREARFYEADLRGRWLMVRYYGVAPVVTTNDGLNYHEGWHFSNQEGGQSAVKASNIAICGRGMLGYMLPTKGKANAVCHSGKRAVEVFQSLLGRVVAYSWNGKLLEEHLTRANSERLGFGLASNLAEDARQRSLLRRLAKPPITETIAARIIANALIQPYNETKPRPASSLSRNDLADRTVLDLSASASREAKLRDIAIRESLERLAYRLLVGDVRVV